MIGAMVGEILIDWFHPDMTQFWPAYLALLGLFLTGIVAMLAGELTGMAEENVATLRKAIEYLRKHGAADADTLQ